MKSAAIFLALVTLCGGTQVTSRTAVLQHDLEESLKERPVTKVINMLKDMKAEIEAEMEDDKDVYEKVQCWCETGIKEKTKAIEEGEAMIEQLNADIEEYLGKLGETKELLANSKKEKNKNFDDLNKASAMRMKENGEFHETEKQLMGAIHSARDALTVLSEQHPDLLQLRKLAKKLSSLPENFVAESSLSRDQVGTFKSFLQGAATATSRAAFLAVPGMQSYAPQGGAIVGILKQMKEDFEKDLKELQENEAKVHKEFTDLKAATEGEMAAGTKMIEQGDTDLATYSEKKAQAEEMLADTEEQLAKDKTFLANLKKKCDENEKEYAKRVKAKLDELGGVSDTIGFLDSDEAHAMFDKTVNSMFLQKSQKSITFDKAQEKMMRRKVIQSLETLAIKTQSPRIILLVTKAHLDAFTEVKAEIDKMIAELKTQQADEVKKRDWCIKELNANTLSLDAKYDEQANIQDKIETLKASIESFAKEIKTKTEEIAAMQTEMKRGSEDREAENADYQTAVSDQKVTQMILGKALDRMKETYAMLQKRARKGAPHTQTSGTDTEPGSGPARFNESKKNAGGAKVIKMIEDVIAESKATEAEAIAAEQDSQQAYENFMKDSNDSIIEYTKAITNMQADMGAAKEELVSSEEALAATNKELEDLEGTKASLHKECDFLLKNFEVRQTARQSEMDGLAEAKAILSGA